MYALNELAIIVWPRKVKAMHVCALFEHVSALFRVLIAPACIAVNLPDDLIGLADSSRPFNAALLYTAKSHAEMAFLPQLHKLHKDSEGQLTSICWTFPAYSMKLGYTPVNLHEPATSAS